MYLKIAELPRKFKILVMLLSDLCLIPLALWSAIALRLGTINVPMDNIRWIFFVLPLFSIPIFVKLGLYRAVIRYFDEKILFTIVLGMTLSVFLLTTLILMTQAFGIPRSSIVIYWVICVMYMTISRYSARGIIRQIERQTNGRRQKVAIYGAGHTGLQIALSMFSSTEYVPVLFFDDSKELQGTSIAGIRVYDPSKAVDLMAANDCYVLLLALPSAGIKKRQTIIKQFEQKGIQLKIIPGMNAIVDGKVKIDSIREVGVEDLLGRDAVPPDEHLIGASVTNKVVMVTGAGGSIGSELCRQILRRKPKTLVILDQSEFSLYSIEREFKSNTFSVQIIPILCNVLRTDEVRAIMKKYNVDSVYHAAAYKHVPLVESNIISGINNNVFGTLSVLKAMQETNVKKFILISTDKAVRPTNIMGATKRIAEMLVQNYADKSQGVVYSMVRFGNVLGSSGSVIPLFKEQIKAGGPVTVTHPDITRYFMTIPEAAELVLQAGAMATGGELFVLDMGEPVKIVDLAKNMIQLSGFTVRDQDNADGDIEIKFVGLRPGEKLYEELLIANISSRTVHPRIMKATEEGLETNELIGLIEQMKMCCDQSNDVRAKELIQKMVINYTEAKH
jgi:FlaA1/EpsC-like NDP-sugar epimerase